jgi:hypothetical protein
MWVANLVRVFLSWAPTWINLQKLDAYHLLECLDRGRLRFLLTGSHYVFKYFYLIIFGDRISLEAL